MVALLQEAEEMQEEAEEALAAAQFLDLDDSKVGDDEGKKEINSIIRHRLDGDDDDSGFGGPLSKKLESDVNQLRQKVDTLGAQVGAMDAKMDKLLDLLGSET